MIIFDELSIKRCFDEYCLKKFTRNDKMWDIIFNFLHFYYDSNVYVSDVFVNLLCINCVFQTGQRSS